MDTDTSQAFQIREKLAQLEEKLVANVPGIAGLLRDIHRALKNDPDVVTILSEDECATLVNGLKKQTKTEIATKVLKTGGKKAMNKMTVLDL